MTYLGSIHFGTRLRLRQDVISDEQSEDNSKETEKNPANLEKVKHAAKVENEAVTLDLFNWADLA